MELRSPVEKGNPGGLIILDLCNTSHITGKDVVKRFGEVSDLTIPSPEQPEEDPVFLVYKYDWGKLGFGCSRDESDSLVSVVLDAYENWDLAVPGTNQILWSRLFLMLMKAQLLRSTKKAIPRQEYLNKTPW